MGSLRLLHPLGGTGLARDPTRTAAEVISGRFFGPDDWFPISKPGNDVAFILKMIKLRSLVF